MQFVVTIDNEAIAQKILWLLEYFKKDGLKISNIIDSDKDHQQQQYSASHIRENWRELIMTHEDPDINDDIHLEQAHANRNRS